MFFLFILVSLLKILIKTKKSKFVLDIINEDETKICLFAVTNGSVCFNNITLLTFFDQTNLLLLLLSKSS